MIRMAAFLVHIVHVVAACVACCVVPVWILCVRSLFRLTPPQKEGATSDDRNGSDRDTDSDADTGTCTEPSLRFR